MHKKIMTALFCLVLIGCSIWGIAAPDRLYSENEKRMLAKFPSMAIDRILSGKFSSEIEKYMADQFPERDGWVTVKTIKEYALGKRDSGGVYFAKDGYLIEVVSEFDNDNLEKLSAYFKGIEENLSGKGIPVRLMLVPTAGEILSDKLPKFAPMASQEEVLDYMKDKGFTLVDVTPILTDHSSEYIYYKTDHHWTSLGAYYAYAEYMKAIGRTPHALDEYTKEVLSEDFRGTTFNKVNYPFAPYDVIDAYYISDNHNVYYNDSTDCDNTMYTRSFLKSADKYAVFLNSNQASTKIEGSGEGRILIIKDSYANCFAQFLPEDYEEVHMIDLRFFTGDLQEYVDNNLITEVLVLYNIPNFAETKLK
ncbi:MAG: hypothetical protein K6E46_08630 [Lachnospiraceae bacterium]|nr:hypothetical protein [Lachnospiraceae bacterium]